MPAKDNPSEIERLKRKLSRELKAREQAEQLLEKKSAELYKAAERSQVLAQAIESAADGIALTDEHGNFTYMNATHAGMFGYEIEELLGQAWSVLYNKHELNRFETDIMPKFGEAGQWQGDTTGLHKNGSAIYQNVTLTALDDGGLICATRDVTSKRRRDIIVRDMEDRLQEAERAATVVTLGRTIAHDLNNLLAAISGYSMILQSDLEGNTEALERAERIERAAQQAVDVVQSLEGRTSDTPLVVQNIELSKLINTTVQIAKGIRPKRVRFNLDVEDKLIIQSNSILLSRCLLNILKNAMEAMPRNGTIKIKTQVNVNLPHAVKEPSLSLGYPVGACQAKIEIADTGTGMSPEIMRKIFDPFFSTKKHDVGRGLGLQSLKTLAEEGLAFITIDSEVGTGTCFSIYLQDPPDELVSSDEDISVTPSHQQKSILLVEDDELVGDMLGTTLFRMGHHIVWKKNPLEALEIVQMEKFDLVITDYNMPDMSGSILAQNIKSRCPDMPIIIYSGQASELKPNPNFNAILKKPILPDDLELAINSAIEG